MLQHPLLHASTCHPCAAASPLSHLLPSAPVLLLLPVPLPPQSKADAAASELANANTMYQAALEQLNVERSRAADLEVRGPPCCHPTTTRPHPVPVVKQMHG